MTRNYKHHEAARRAKAKREFALERSELRGPSTPHVSAAGVTSAPIKAQDPETEDMIAAFLKGKKRN